MKVLILIKEPRNRLLVHLNTSDLIGRVKEMIVNRDLSKAIEVVLKEGVDTKSITVDEIFMCDADLILTEDFVRWDLLDGKVNQ